MRIEINAPDTAQAGTDVAVRVLLFNDDYSPVAISRNAFIGPNARATTPGGFPYPPNVEATKAEADEPMTLQPFTFYGRERMMSLSPGTIELSATYSHDGVGLSATRQIEITVHKP